MLLLYFVAEKRMRGREKEERRLREKRIRGEEWTLLLEEMDRAKGEERMSGERRGD